MKTNTKTKKSIATKAKATPAKSTVKAKTTAKKVVKPTKVAAKPAAKTTMKKAAPAAKKAPVAKKVVKSTIKTAKTAVQKVKTPVKATKIAVKAVKPVAKATKPVAKAAPVAKTTPVKASTAKVVAAPVDAKKAPVAKASTMTAVKPIVIKMPENQNNSPVRATVMSSTRPVPVAVNKMSSSDASARPVYRPIQVINKSLAPLQPVRQMAPVAKADEKVEFKKGDYVVYPAHGVGEIEAVETQIIGGMEIKLYAIAFEKDRMRLKVPVFKAHASGLRRLSTSNRMQDALKTLQGRAQIRRAMWSRRAQEYETKINSGDPVSIAEVLRDLKRSNDESEQSYSERQIYQSALERLAREVAALEKITEIEAAERLETMIKGKRARATAASNDEAVKEVASA